MAGITAILRHQWLAYWRRFFNTGIGSNLILLIILIWVIVARLPGQLRLMTQELTQQRSERFEMILLTLSLTWLLPLLSDSQLSIRARNLLHLPFSVPDLLIIRIASIMMQPSSWLLLLISLACAYPILFTRHDLIGLIALALYYLAVAGTTLTISHLMQDRSWRNRSIFTALILLAVLSIMILRSNNVARTIDEIMSLMPGHFIARLLFTNNWSEIALIITSLCLVMSISWWTAQWSFNRYLHPVPAREPQQRWRIKIPFPGRLAGLCNKEYRAYWRLLDLYLGWIVVLICCCYLMFVVEVSARVLQIVLLFLMLPFGGLITNQFGLDAASSLNRYALLPITGREVMLVKNLAFLAVLLTQLIPILLLAGLRFNLTTNAIIVSEIVAVTTIYLTLGNFNSIARATKIEFYHFSQSSTPIEDLICAGLSSMPGLIIIMLGTEPGYYWLILPIVIGCGGIYYTALNRAGRRFETNWQIIRDRLN